MVTVPVPVIVPIIELAQPCWLYTCSRVSGWCGPSRLSSRRPSGGGRSRPDGAIKTIPVAEDKVPVQWSNDLEKLFIRAKKEIMT